jgi:hypothetical protein
MASLQIAYTNPLSKDSSIKMDWHHALIEMMGQTLRAAPPRAR